MTTRVFITGGSGFLGQHLRTALDKARLKTRLLLRRAPAGPRRKADTVVGDLLQLSEEELRAGMQGCDSVIHLAGRVSRDAKRSGQMMRLHYEGTRRLLIAAARAHVKRVVVASSSGTIAVSTQPGVALDETAPYATHLVSKFPYYLSKIAQEKLAFELGAELGLEIVVVNPSLLLGPGDVNGSSNGDLQLLARGYVPIAPSGGVAFADVRDVAEALLNALLAGRAGERYLVSGYNWTLREFFRCASAGAGRRGPLFTIPAGLEQQLGNWLTRSCDALGMKPPIDAVTLGMGRLFWYCDTSKARSELGLDPRDPLDTLSHAMRQVLASADPRPQTLARLPARSSLTYE